MSEQRDNLRECKICLELIELSDQECSVCNIPDHIFHCDCILKIIRPQLNSNPKCPICKSNITDITNIKQNVKISMKSINEILEKCSICWEPLNDGSRICYGCENRDQPHLYHCKCIENWKKQNNSCPACRRRLGIIKDIYEIPYGDFKNMDEKEINEEDEEMNFRREELLEENGQFIIYVIKLLREVNSTAHKNLPINEIGIEVNDDFPADLTIRQYLISITYLQDEIKSEIKNINNEEDIIRVSNRIYSLRQDVDQNMNIFINYLRDNDEFFNEHLPQDRNILRINLYNLEHEIISNLIDVKNASISHVEIKEIKEIKEILFEDQENNINYYLLENLTDNTNIEQFLLLYLQYLHQLEVTDINSVDNAIDNFRMNELINQLRNNFRIYMNEITEYKDNYNQEIKEELDSELNNTEYKDSRINILNSRLDEMLKEIRETYRDIIFSRSNSTGIKEVYIHKNANKKITLKELMDSYINLFKDLKLEISNIQKPEDEILIMQRFTDECNTFYRDLILIKKYIKKKRIEKENQDRIGGRSLSNIFLYIILIIITICLLVRILLKPKKQLIYYSNNSGFSNI
jgi:hypothetical protein